MVQFLIGRIEHREQSMSVFGVTLQPADERVAFSG